MKPVDMSKFSKKYKNKWVALNDKMNKVMVSGSSAHEVLVKARKLGMKEPTITLIPSKSKAYIL